MGVRDKLEEMLGALAELEGSMVEKLVAECWAANGGSKEADVSGDFRRVGGGICPT